jgi:hypothetical protein
MQLSAIQVPVSSACDGGAIPHAPTTQVIETDLIHVGNLLATIRLQALAHMAESRLAKAVHQELARPLLVSLTGYRARTKATGRLGED